MKDILPPILPDVEKQLKEYLICPEHLPIHDYENNQEFWTRKDDISPFYNIERAPIGTTLTVQRNPDTGKIVEFFEISFVAAGSKARNSTSLTRAPAPPAELNRGDTLNFPFWPGGMPSPVIEITEDLSADFTELLTVPPDFSRGLQLKNTEYNTANNVNDVEEKSQIFENEADRTVDLLKLIQEEQNSLSLWNETKENSPTNIENISSKRNLEVDENELLPKDQLTPLLKISEFRKSLDSEWAVMVDIKKPVLDFHERIPDPAHKYPFELDTFQKQAILKLEENCDVFVAAHTSAGKTVVAEYAIALSQNHKTCTIYTSPIKALSNQKYRDFKHIFQDVGLITGDFQINPTAVCLIMTTEILRSMLYCGSEIIRDLEYVIFDEVHYINDAERGHVWEEILILLPSHVRIVLLSATVPNTLEFASWLGHIKQRKVYVISTLHRPVPLQHYLYTGCGGKSKDERFIIIDDKGNFHFEKHKEAMAVVTKRLESNQNKFGRHDRTKQEVTAWSGLVDHLKRNELLPVIVFTFSRSLCDKSADALKFLDLTTGKEKSMIHSFYQQCIKRLKEPDQKLPQIITMQEILKNGIGVHHSGVLPIVKEIVEMLFQNGLVKILFATETFAMGVNMPARTVIFNGIQKFDGKESRYLNPAEYIQMAGRAGRRGLDKTGTVIIRCSHNVPDSLTLRTMMQGKPQKLESQFRLTYGMLLSLLRVESLSIESMMTHSFHEVNHVSQSDQLKIDLKRTEEELATESLNEIGEHLQHLMKYYVVASEFIEQYNKIQPKVMSQPRVVKEMVPGRVLLVSHKTHYKKLAILLKVNSKKEIQYKVLVLAHQKEISDSIQLVTDDKASENKSTNTVEHPDSYYKMLSFAQEEIFQPDGVGGHEVLDITPPDIMEISTKILKVDTELVIKDWEKRQIPRFRDDMPGQSCYQAIQELAKLTQNCILLESEITFHDINDFRINDIDLVQQLVYMKLKKKELSKYLNYTRTANFDEQFKIVYKRKFLEEKVENIKFMISYRSLSLYPEYLSRIKVLQELGYINDQNRVDLKGRVACGIGMNELLVTELVFRNTLTNLKPCEIAALLSALVFQAKSEAEPRLTETLEKAIKEITEINEEIEGIESRQQIRSSEGNQPNLNFKLVEVVYEWAQEKPFADIMSLTDIQEGIIVRCIQQLNETIKDVKEAAIIIGDPVLQKKMDEASNAIKRDIVFAASLYTQREAANIGI